MCFCNFEICNFGIHPRMYACSKLWFWQVVDWNVLVESCIPKIAKLLMIAFFFNKKNSSTFWLFSYLIFFLFYTLKLHKRGQSSTQELEVGQLHLLFIKKKMWHKGLFYPYSTPITSFRCNILFIALVLNNPALEILLWVCLSSLQTRVLDNVCEV